MEYEADLYGINASQQPDGEAEVDLMLGEYRKMDPGPIEEFIFFDHPAGAPESRRRCAGRRSICRVRRWGGKESGVGRTGVYDPHKFWQNGPLAMGLKDFHRIRQGSCHGPGST